MTRSLRQRVRDGDGDAFAELFEQSAGRVYNYAFRLLGDWAGAEDVVSLTFLEAWRGRHKVNADGGPLVPWLLGIATNVSRNTTRTRRRHAAAMERLPEPRAVPDIAEEVVGRADNLDRQGGSPYIVLADGQALGRDPDGRPVRYVVDVDRLPPAFGPLVTTAEDAVLVLEIRPMSGPSSWAVIAYVEAGPARLVTWIEKAAPPSVSVHDRLVTVRLESGVQNYRWDRNRFVRAG
ncbi:RNA polymerase sigma factor [Cryptosporangium aurantiacum]|uniref:Sigma-70 region 2 n=1 Tax=Cryptosporangium aurantiacum TaxID=134849 RepID=A0A1M7R7L2_9ACTN|nr:sigma factor [Cryptosporangium aurantiacum]SHN42160.1 Sigma-70 region 2 [Cryptosporangium aurantiacum]